MKKLKKITVKSRKYFIILGIVKYIFRYNLWSKYTSRCFFFTIFIIINLDFEKYKKFKKYKHMKKLKYIKNKKFEKSILQVSLKKYKKLKNIKNIKN